MKTSAVTTAEAATTPVITTASSMSAATPTSKCRGRGSKCHCQTGRSYRSIFHNCFLHYG